MMRKVKMTVVTPVVFFFVNSMPSLTLTLATEAKENKPNASPKQQP